MRRIARFIQSCIRLRSVSLALWVERHNKTEKWRACISIGGKRVQLGVADNAEDAARIYDIAAIRHFGEFATLNFPKMVA